MGSGRGEPASAGFPLLRHDGVWHWWSRSWWSSHSRRGCHRQSYPQQIEDELTVLSKLLRVGEGRMVKRLKHIADHVSTLSGDVEKLTDAELRAKTDEFRKRYADGETLDELLPESFAVAREAAWRVLSQRHFDVQVMGGAALHFGNIAEMKTGEGKTLTCVLPAYLNAIAQAGVHVV